MKKLISSLLLALMVCGMTSCRNDYDPLADGNYRLLREKNRSISKTVSMSFTGDIITESEEPLQRAEDDGDAYAAVNVWRTKKEVNAQEEKYAYGLFKNSVDFDVTKDIKIDLLTGYTYRFESTILVEKEDRVFHRVNDTKAYQQPFRLHDKNSSNFDNAWGYPDSDLKNKFIYTWDISDPDQREYFCELASGTAYVNSGSASDQQYADKSYPRVKRFYGKTPEAFPYDPEVSDRIEINMGYKCFGLVVHVNNLPAGSVTVKDVTKKSNGNSKDTKELLEFIGFELSNDGELDWEELYSMNQLLSDSETFNLEFTWNKPGGEKEKFSSGDIVIRPKTRKILNLNITGTVNTPVQGNIILTKESESLTDDPENISN